MFEDALITSHLNQQYLVPLTNVFLLAAGNFIIGCAPMLIEFEV